MAAAVPLKQDTGELSEFLTGDFLPVANGGTGAITAGAACTALGALAVANNLSDVTSAGPCRANLLVPLLNVFSGGTDASSTPAIGSTGSPYIHTATLTANRNLTLSTAAGANTRQWTVVRTGAGAFTLSVIDQASATTLKALSTNQWMDAAFDGANWKLIRFGSL